MSYQSEHQRLKPVLDLARQLDIATNPDPQAIFEAGNSGFQVWCIPYDHPQDWDGIVMNSGAFSKPCEYVGCVHWKWDDDRIVALELETSAYALADQKPNEYCNLTNIPKGFNRRTIVNREADLEWLKEKVTWLFEAAGVPLLPIEHEAVAPSTPDPYLLVHYLSGHDEYVVIVSPGRQPQEFCLRGYEVAGTLQTGDVGNLPTDVVLRPERYFPEPDPEQESDELEERLENVTRTRHDDWLKPDFEDRASGLEA